LTFTGFYKAEEGREDLEAKGGRRVLRGGSFLTYVDLARCSYRLNVDPGHVWNDLGCRVGWCAAPALPLDSGF
jgi:formylglycine-generating enzyme required for sulfatase activity